MLQIAIAMLIVIAGSAFCSCSETALLSVSPIRTRQLAQSRKPAALALHGIRERMNRPISTIVMLNNIFNIVGTAVITGLAAKNLQSNTAALIPGILTFLIIIFAEIFPKNLGERYAESVGLAVALPIASLTWLLTPLVMLLELLTSPITKGNRGPTTNEAEIKLLTRIGYQEGLIEDDEADMIQRVFRLNDVTAGDLMTPRVALTYLHGDETLGDSKADILNSQHSRIVVVDESVDRVAGVALRSELLTAMIDDKYDATVASLARPVQFVPEVQRADRLLKTFRESREHLVVVLDEYGGVSGVVTLEDVLEELTGEIVDETDRNVDLQALARLRRRRLLRKHGIDSNEESTGYPADYETD